MAASTRLSTHSGRSCRLRTVWELTLIPSIAVLPTHHADDMGAMLVVPSPLSELISSTGVPKYSILGVRTRFTGPPQVWLPSLPGQRGGGADREMTQPAGMVTRVTQPIALWAETRKSARHAPLRTHPKGMSRRLAHGASGQGAPLTAIVLIGRWMSLRAQLADRSG